MDTEIILYILVCTAITISKSPVTGFLLDDDCPAPPPCTCTSRSIDCDNMKDLTKPPVFRNSTTKMTAYWYLQLRNNSLSALPNDSFYNLRSVTSDGGIDVSLQRNNLQVDGIDVNAFRGIDDKVVSLNLAYNNLTSVPLAISSLKRLQILYLNGNPIKSIDSAAFRSLRNTLGYLEISLPYVTQWPNAMHYLTSLGGLEVENFHHSVTDDAFSGFRSSLTSLKLRDVNFTTLPSAICKLHNLKSLYIMNNMDLDGKNFIYCNPPLKALKKLVMSDNYEMTTFPHVFSSFLNLTDIEISGSSISLIDDYFVPSNTTVSTLKLAESNLTALPGAVNKFTLLSSCNLQGNQIRLVERHSIVNLLDLRQIELDNNPIVFVSREAFSNVPNLAYLGLSGTLLTQIPLVVENVLNIMTVYLGSNAVLCNCELPHVLTKHYVYGFCSATNETISHFLKNDLPKCP